jgi:hypothetical protein
MTPKQTPWGAAQDFQELAPGIISISTASHGGIWLSGNRRMEIGQYDKNWLGTSEWWEEDCDWSIPYAFFSKAIREHGTAYKIEENIQAALNTIKNHAPEFMPRLEGRLF